MDTHTLDGVLSEFIHTLGIDSTAYSGSKVISISLEKSGLYFIEHCENGVVVYLVRQYHELSSSILIKILQTCDHRFNGQNRIYGGLCEGNNLMYIVHIEASNLTVQSLYGEMDKLCNLHDAIEE